ncbi:MAG: hypothetical protein FD167_5021 [bacterium]|nr:MAG: hypothetical protein FD167_5021 [bacterium]
MIVLDQTIFAFALGVLVVVVLEIDKDIVAGGIVVEALEIDKDIVAGGIVAGDKQDYLNWVVVEVGLAKKVNYCFDIGFAHFVHC